MDSKTSKSKIQCCIDLVRKLPPSNLTKNIQGNITLI